MIHQFIFAGPKPGFTAEQFQDYWLNIHAVKYASKIPQINQYMVNLRLPIEHVRSLPFHQGMAEIWFTSDEQQMASLQSSEFIDGARADEPNWAAFWATQVIDTESSVLFGDSAPNDIEYAKVYVLLKRRGGESLERFHDQLKSEEHRSLLAKLPSVERVELGLSRSGNYGFGEPRYDAIEVLSFNDAATLEDCLSSKNFLQLEENWDGLDESSYRFYFFTQDHWIIRPGDRQN